MPITAILGSFTTFKHALISWEGTLWTNNTEIPLHSFKFGELWPTNSWDLVVANFDSLSQTDFMTASPLIRREYFRCDMGYRQWESIF